MIWFVYDIYVINLDLQCKYCMTNIFKIYHHSFGMDYLYPIKTKDIYLCSSAKTVSTNAHWGTFGVNSLM